MKSITLLLLMIISSFVVSAQITEKFYDYKWNPTILGLAHYYSLQENKDDLWHRQDFFVSKRTLYMQGVYLDQDCKVQHGDFKYFYSNGQLESNGKYLNGKKDGLWLIYHPNGMMKDSAKYENGEVIGTRLRWHQNGYASDSIIYYSDDNSLVISWFDNGIPSSAGYCKGDKVHGKWQYFHKNGQLSALINYEENIILEAEYYTEKGEKLLKPLKDSEATFPGGMERWTSYLYRNVKFPEKYRLNNTNSVTVVVSARIDEDGKVCDLFVALPFHPEFDKMIAHAMKTAPKWKPAVSNNRKVSFFIRQPLTFAQED